MVPQLDLERQGQLLPQCCFLPQPLALLAALDVPEVLLPDEPVLLEMWFWKWLKEMKDEVLQLALEPLFCYD